MGGGALSGDGMDSELPLFGDAELTAQATALAETVVAIRIAQGKTIPRDLPVDSPDWETIALEFAKDVERVLTAEAIKTSVDRSR